MPDGLFSRRGGVDRVERQGDFNELFAGRHRGFALMEAHFSEEFRSG